MPPNTVPAVPRGEITEPPPDIRASLPDKTPPRFFGSGPEAPPPRPGPADQRLRRAEERFQTGKRLLATGDRDGARREFDRAIDILLASSENLPDRQRIEKRYEELVDLIHRYDLEELGAAEPDRLLTFEKSPLDEILELTFPLDPRLKSKVREEVQATLSQLPLEVTDPVLSYIHYFSSDRGRRTIQAGLRYAGRYRPLISRILDEEGVPRELMQLAQAESGFMPRAVSRKSATGMWQFVRFRGREYGLQQSPYHDDRLDPEKSTRAAARHLRDLYQQFGDWYLAMAAYNCGPLTVERAIQRTGYADFWELRSRNVLPRETANYVPAILAMIIVIKNARDYGLEDAGADAPLEYDTLELTAPAHLPLLADAADRPVSVLRELNPSLLKNLAPAGFQLHVPKGTAMEVASALDLVPAERRNSWRIHRTGGNETLAAIARRFGSSVGSLQSANRALTGDPRSGDLVIVPAAPRPEPRSVARKAPAARRTATARSSPAKKPAAAVRVAQAAARPAAAARR
ncbi:MAG: transglycosylase SLT domain-containing protein [Acidobacteria bacterium]|nr:transglycosylase SLT domain-containing protein [Acidobacteriota bacterium]